MVSIFRDKSAANVFWIIGLSILLHAHFFIFPAQVISGTNDGFIASILDRYILPLPAVVITILYQITVIVQALRLNYILNDVRMFQKPAFTAAMAYLLFTAMLPDWSHFSPALLTNSFIIWLVYLVARLYNTAHAKSLIYNIGLVAGIAIAGYYPALPLIIIIYFALAILRPFHANEWFILLAGLITPFYFLAAVFFVNDQLALMARYIPAWNPHLIHIDNLKPALATYSLMAVSILAGLLIWQKNNGRMLLQARKVWGVLLMMLILFIPPIFLINGVYTQLLLLAFVPAAAFAANFFLYPRNVLFPAIIFWLCVAVVVYNNWFMAKN